ACEADERTASISSPLVSPGYRCHTPASRLVIRGADSDVPLDVLRLPVAFTTDTPIPIAATSGLILPSADGLIVLIGLLTPPGVTAATARTYSLSAGVVMVSHELLPSFPALETTAIPLSEAHCAALAMTLV